VSGKVGIVAAGSASGLGFEWVELGTALLEGAPGSPREVPVVPVHLDVGDVRQRRLMSRPAHLAAVVVHRALADASWSGDRSDIGMFLGVGASVGRLEDLVPVLKASVENGHVSPQRLGRRGLAAVNPLLVFQLLNNFTLCHAAILEELGGPTSTFYSTGSGTVIALQEAIHSLSERDCARALAGGADTALHPLRLSELTRDGFAGQGLEPAEAAAVLALERSPARALAWVEHCTVLATAGSTHAELDSAMAGACGAESVDAALIVPWGTPARTTLEQLVQRGIPEARLIDVTRTLGESLAAAPALGWVGALGIMAKSHVKNAIVLSLGIDDELGMVRLRRWSAT
jgi:hypothetical protein